MKYLIAAFLSVFVVGVLSQCKEVYCGPHSTHDDPLPLKDTRTAPCHRVYCGPHSTHHDKRSSSDSDGQDNLSGSGMTLIERIKPGYKHPSFYRKDDYSKTGYDFGLGRRLQAAGQVSST